MNKTDTVKSVMLLGVITVMSLLVRLIWMVWSLDRGLDFTDEAAMLMTYTSDELTIFHLPSLAPFFIRDAFAWVPLNIVTARIIDIVLETFAAGILIFGTLQFFRKKIPSFSSGPVILFVGLMSLYLTTLPLSVSHDDLANLGLYLGGTIALLFWKSDSKSLFTCSFWGIAAGLPIGFLFFTRFPSAVLFFILFTLFSMYFKRDGLRLIILTLSSLLGASLFYLIILLVGYGPEFHLMSGLFFDIMPLSGESPFDIVLEKNIKVDLIQNFILLFPSLCLLAGAYLFARKKPEKIGLIFSIVSIVGLAIIPFVHSVLFKNWSGLELWDWKYLFLDFYLYIALAALTIILSDKSGSPVNYKVKDLVMVCIFLLSITLSAIGGSDSYVSDLFYDHAHPFFLVLGLILGYIGVVLKKRKLMVFLAITFLIASQAQFFAYRYQPFYLSSPVMEQQYTFDSNVPIKLDKESLEFVTDVKKALEDNGYQKGDDILAFVNMPGIVYLLGGHSPGVNQFFPAIPGFETDISAINCYYLKRVKEVRSRPFVLLSDFASDKDIACLANTYVDFPNDYKFLGTTYYPNPLFKSEVKIYAPLEKTE